MVQHKPRYLCSNQQMNLIGISGKKHSGKDEAYKAIVAAYPLLKVARIGFADALKAEIAVAFGTSVEYIEANKSKFRHILQAWGHGRREITNKAYWIDKVARLLHESTADIVIIPDVRYLNEAELIHMLKGYLVRIERSCLPVDDPHSSETSLDGYQRFDFVIQNNGTLTDLYKTVKAMLIKMRNGN